MSDEPAPLSERAAAASSGELNALLGRGARFAGKLTFEGKVRIDGAFEGEVFSDGILIVGDEAEVTARIEVGTLIVRGGTVRGDVKAAAAVEVYAPSKLYGDLTAPEVFIDKGVTFEGHVKMTDREER
ncbi:MAG: polymer-forming cytoskeletal protein [Polyangiales bacterium]